MPKTDRKELARGVSGKVERLAEKKDASSFLRTLHHDATPAEMVEVKLKMIAMGAMTSGKLAGEIARMMWRVNRHAMGFPGLERIQSDIQRYARERHRASQGGRPRFGAERGRLDKAHATWLHTLVIGTSEDERRTPESMAVLGVLQLANGCFYQLKFIGRAVESFAVAADLSPETSRTREAEERIQSEMMAIRDRDGSLARRFV